MNSNTMVQTISEKYGLKVSEIEGDYYCESLQLNQIDFDGAS